MPADRRSKKRLVWGAAIAALVVLLALVFRPTALPVETATVTRGPLEVTIDADGVTRVVDRFQIAAPVTGRLQRITVREGDPVAQGDVLARITPAPLDPQATTQARAALAAAEARVEEANTRVVQARATMDLALRTAERVRSVFADGGLSAEALDRAELEATNAEREHEAALARVRAAQSEASAARAALLDVDPSRSAGGAGAEVRSPAAGRVLRVHERSERVVPAGTPLVDVGDASGLEVVVDVLSSDAVRIVPGSPLRIEEWGGDTPLTGHVSQIEPAAFTRVSALGVEEQRVNVVGQLLDAPPSLGDGYRVEARIVEWQGEDTLKLPAGALFQGDGEEWEVFVVQSGRAELRPVQIGHRGLSEVEILGGLAEGDEVILFPSDELRDGVRVRAAN